MSNIAQLIMEGATIGASVTRENLSKYGHENGATLIAMESAEALQQIFEAEFYVPNTCSITAALEGATSVEESTQAEVMEASIKDAFTKIKEFFIELKDKVVAFLHNIKRYLLGIFGNDVKWVNTYEKELKAIKSENLKDYEIKMYNYIDLEKEVSTAIDDVERIAGDAESTTRAYITEFNKMGVGMKGSSDEEMMDTVEKCKETLDSKIPEALGALIGKSKVDIDEYDKELWSYFRSGAESDADMDDVKVSGNITKFIDTIKNSEKNLSNWDKAATKADKTYKKMIKLVDDAAKKADGASDLGKNGGTKYTAKVAEILRHYSSYVSKIQGYENKFYSAGKSAMVERNAAYKRALTGAFSYAKKHAK